MNKLQQDNAKRTAFYETIKPLEIGGYDFLGQSTEGLIFSNGSDCIVVKVIVKKADFDSVDAIEEYTEKLTEADKKVAEKAAKLAKVEAEKASKKAEKATI